MYRFLSSQKSLPGTPRAPARMHISLHGGKGFANLTRRRRPSSASVLLVAGFGAFLAFLDSTIVNIAFPDIQRSFPSYDIGSLSWILNGYNIVFAAFMVAAGRLADLLGRRRTFLSGVLVFTIASGLCAVAGSVEQLVAFRVLQGIGAAILVPASPRPNRWPAWLASPPPPVSPAKSNTSDSVGPQTNNSATPSATSPVTAAEPTSGPPTATTAPSPEDTTTPTPCASWPAPGSTPSGTAGKTAPPTTLPTIAPSRHCSTKIKTGRLDTGLLIGLAGGRHQRVARTKSLMPQTV